ncbi:MAG: prephenate dehydrogenase [bacterium ADurb.Bin478]|nr:MAG: prephenate dehydrogenase [bacterium ADurb.Bin478]
MGEIEQFKRVVIVGVGLIGGSLALALKKKGFKGKICGVDSAEVLALAEPRRMLDESYTRDRLLEAVIDADIVFLCTPILDILRLIPEIGPAVKAGALITDVGSTKRTIVETASIYLPVGVDFIGGHPMAGSETKGVEGADPFLFENTTYVLTPVRSVNEQTRKALGELIELIGAKVLLLSPVLHDEIAAAVSHLPQMAAIAMMTLAAKRQSESPYFLKMAAGGFRDMTRIASSPYGIWEHIRQTNADMIAQYIDAYIEELSSLRDRLNSEALGKIFTAASESRLSIPRDTRGFLRPHYDISVSVEDRPGMLALIANTLLEKNINIKDIEILKIREDEGGTMRLAFATQSERDLSLSLLRDKGLECRKRD